MPPAQFAEGMEGLDHSGPLRPAAARPAASVTTATSPADNAARPGLAIFRRQTARASNTSPSASWMCGAGRQAVLRQSDPPVLEVGPDLLVTGAVETVFRASPPALRRRGGLHGARQQRSKNRARRRPIRAAWQAAANLSSSARRKGATRVQPEQLRHDHGVVTWRQQGVLARQQVGPGAALVDGEVIDHGVHGEGQGGSMAKGRAFCNSALVWDMIC